MTNESSMQEKVAIITGGAQGIGRELAQTLLQQGYSIAIWDSDQEALTETEQTLQPLGSLLVLRCNVGKAAEVEQAFQATLNHYGQLDVLINNAAVFEDKPIEEWSFEDWDQGLGINLSGPFYASKLAASHLKKTQGSIINLCSTRAFQSEPGTFAYSASKGGIFALTHSLAISLGPDVRVNCISPGWIDVSSLKKSSVRQPEKLSEADHEQHPAGRVGQAGDIARMVLFLLNPDNSFITGQNFFVDGGMTRKMIYV
ncbi:SDR family NAD(P)-dependent oxidoreductase [Siphonobacter sp. BAB-5385]|uniref:SDR family NAD(P)-dependent oxidoreductase n=1 Tax=Siphonobacter sp. BAB-5385 TaxID=1864822 RepID=UPI0020CF0F28|nr:SDR family oxidoreductase [Siphonobacter sp. BAB-5385]